MTAAKPGDSTAKQIATAATARADKWEGPTSGPKAVAGKTIVYVAGDMRNGGILGVSNGVKEAAGVIGWTYRVIDGQGSVSGQASRFATTVVTASGGGWKDEAWAMATWIWRNFTAPRPAMSAPATASIEIILLVIGMTPLSSTDRRTDPQRIDERTRPESTASPPVTCDA